MIYEVVGVGLKTSNMKNKKGLKQKITQLKTGNNTGLIIYFGYVEKTDTPPKPMTLNQLCELLLIKKYATEDLG